MLADLKDLLEKILFLSDIEINRMNLHELIDKDGANIQHAIIACLGGSCVQKCKNKQK